MTFDDITAGLDIDSTEILADLIDDITGLIDDNDFLRAIGVIIANAPLLDADAVREIMRAATVADPTFSGAGAEIRDTLRDNTDLTIL